MMDSERACSASNPPASPGHNPEDPFRNAVDAAEMGTWDWDIASGEVTWTARTYRLFGYRPESIVTSHELFLSRVHVEDRPSVVEWIDRAMREGSRTMLEFRIEREDGSVRWVRSVGRTVSNGNGQPTRMIGLVEDVTEEKELRNRAPARALQTRANDSFPSRRVARILGISEATVRRLAQAGRIGFLRSTRKDSRRFAPEHVIAFLRRTVTTPIDFNSAARAEDVDACLLYLLEQLLKDRTFEDLLDTEVRSACGLARPRFVAVLLSRLPFLVPERRRTAFPALVARAGAAEAWEAELIGCVLRTHGRDVLSPAGNTDLGQLASLAHRIRARLVVLAIGRGPAEVQSGGLCAAADIAAGMPTTTVCVRYDGSLPVPSGIARLRSMSDLGSVLRGLEPR